MIGRLDRVKQLLAELRPLNLRLEVLEDLFSLLFTTGDDIRQQTGGVEVLFACSIDISTHGTYNTTYTVFQYKSMVVPVCIIGLLT